MSTCYKCGRELPGVANECEGECGSLSPEAQLNALREALRDRVHIDWAKVKTADDAILVLSIIFHEVSLARDSRAAHFLARYLRDDSNNQSGANTNPS